MCSAGLRCEVHGPSPSGSTVCRPVAASPHTSRPSISSTTVRIAWRKPAWSSTTSTRTVMRPSIHQTDRASTTSLVARTTPSGPDRERSQHFISMQPDPRRMRAWAGLITQQRRHSVARAISRQADASNGRPTAYGCRRRAGAAVAFRTAGGSGDRNDGGESAARVVSGSIVRAAERDRGPARSATGGHRIDRAA